MGEIAQDGDQRVYVKIVTPSFSLYYGLFTYLEYGSIEPEDLKKHLTAIRKLLIDKYGEADFRVKYLDLSLLKNETREFNSEEKDWIRYILHAECDPEDPPTGISRLMRRDPTTVLLNRARS